MANIKLNNNEYPIPDSALAPVTADFVAHLGTIAGSGLKVVVGGVEYGIDSSKVAGAVSELEGAFGKLENPTPEEERLEGDGAEYYTLLPTTLQFRSSEPLDEFKEVKINGQTVDSSNYTLEEGSTIVKLSANYLQTLGAGNYEITIVSQNKTTKGHFSVKDPALNEYGFYYRQAYLAYVAYFDAHVAISFHEDGLADVIILEQHMNEIDNYTVSGNTITIVTASMGALHFTISDDGTSIYNIELATTLAFVADGFVSDEEYVYADNTYSYYVYSVLDRTKSSYGTIRTGINGKRTEGIYQYAFAACENLTTITLPAYITVIYDYAFTHCSNLKEVICENCKVSVFYSAFQDCPLITGVTKKHSYVNSDYICDRCGRCEHLHTELRNVKEPTCSEEGYTGDIICTGCGATVTKGTAIERLGHIDNDLDSYCDRCGSSVVGLFDENDNLIASWDDLVNIYGMNASIDYTNNNYKTSITSPYFILTNNNNLSSGRKLVIGDIDTIANYAFAECSNLTSITIPASLTSIGKYAFYGCTGLIQNENGVSYVDKWVVDSNIHVTTVALRENTVGISSYAFQYRSSLTSITIPDSVTSIGSYAFDNCTGLTSINIPESVTSIDSYVFHNCKSLTSITIPSSVTSIGDYAFYYCSRLTSITIPASVTSIGNSVFSGCTGLTSITIPDSVTSIDWAAFSGCNNLTSLTLPFVGATLNGTENTHLGYIFGATSSSYNGSNVPATLKTVVITGGSSIGDWAFYNCTGLTSVTIPAGVTSIGDAAFRDCTGLTSITIPDGITTIGFTAFLGCTGLASITIPSSVTLISNRLFDGCSSLISIIFNGTIAQWNSISKGVEWNYNVPITHVQCSDGQVAL